MSVLFFRRCFWQLVSMSVLQDRSLLPSAVIRFRLLNFLVESWFLCAIQVPRSEEEKDRGIALERRGWEVEWSEVKWNGVKWSEVKWSEVKWSEVKWSETKGALLTWATQNRNFVYLGTIVWNTFYCLHGRKLFKESCLNESPDWFKPCSGLINKQNV